MVVADTPSPFQGRFFEAMEAAPGIDLEVLYCRRSLAERSIWQSVAPGIFRYRFLRELRIGGKPTNPGLLIHLLRNRDRVPILIGYYLPAMLVAGLVLSVLGRPWAFWVDAYKPRPVKDPFRRAAQRLVRHWFATRPTLLLVTGSPGRASLIEYGASPDKICLVPFVVDAEQIAATVDRLRSESPGINGWVPPSTVRVIAFVGRLIPLKGVDFLIDGFGQFTKMEQGEKPLHLVIVGDGPQRDALRERVRRLELSDRVQFLAALPAEKVSQVWASADAMVLASRADAFPVTVLEALAAGVPVIGSTSCGSVVDRVENGVNGWTFPADDSAALVAVLDKFARLRPEELAAMSRAARRSMEQWSAEGVAHTVAGFLRQGLQTAGVRPTRDWSR